MTNAEPYHFADFTRANHRRLLALARRTYTFRRYTDFDRAERFVLWRHDVDFSMHGARRLAEIEAEEGVVATYFVDLHSRFYNLLELEVTAAVSAILELGHEVGLHFDAAYDDIESTGALEERLGRDRRMVEELTGRKMAVFSFHVPTEFTLGCRDWQYGGLINATADYFRQEVGYCSDSNGYWRHRRLQDVLEQASDARLQVLTHPAWWQDAVMSPKERLERCAAGRGQNSLAWYERVAREGGRKVVDWE